MVSATADPLVEVQETWTNLTTDTYLVVYRYALGMRVYLFENVAPEQSKILTRCHNRFVNDLPSDGVATDIRSIPQDYPEKLIYDTAEGAEMPLIERPIRVILTGL